MTEPTDGALADGPIDELRDLQLEPRAGFLGRVTRRVERRRLAADTADLTLSSVQLLFWQFLEMVFDVFGSGRDKKGEGR